MKCLVVGGAGYIGRELCRQLAARGDDLYVLARSSPPKDMPGIWFQADIRRLESIQAGLGDHKFDVIFHTASHANDYGDPVDMVATNLQGLVNMLTYARDTKAGRFVLTSSVSAHGWYPGARFHTADYLPVDEEHPTRPEDMYSSTKRMQEILGLTFYHQYGLLVTALRLTVVAGPAGYGGSKAWRTFAEKLHEGKSVQIFHFSPEEICHYVDVRDVARMHLVAGEHPNAPGEIFNCCGPTPTRGSEFAAMVERLAPGIKVEYGFPWSLAQGGEIYFTMAKAKELLGYEPEYSFEQTLGSIKQWVDEGGLVKD
jgi:nucleoside-diphosphate-sugar epimerase